MSNYKNISNQLPGILDKYLSSPAHKRRRKIIKRMDKIEKDFINGKPIKYTPIKSN